MSVSQRKHPHCPSLGYFRKLARTDRVQAALHPGGVDAPSRLDCHVLTSVEGERRRLTDYTRVCWILPEDLSSPGVECPEHAVRRTAAKDQSATGRHQWPPVRRLGKRVSPHARACVHVPRLHFSDVI